MTLAEMQRILDELKSIDGIYFDEPEYWGDGEWFWFGLAYDEEGSSLCEGNAYYEVHAFGNLGKGLEINIG